MSQNFHFVCAGPTNPGPDGGTEETIRSSSPDLLAADDLEHIRWLAEAFIDPRMCGCKVGPCSGVSGERPARPSEDRGVCASRIDTAGAGDRILHRPNFDADCVDPRPLGFDGPIGSLPTGDGGPRRARANVDGVPYKSIQPAKRVSNSPVARLSIGRGAGTGTISDPLHDSPVRVSRLRQHPPPSGRWCNGAARLLTLALRVVGSKRFARA